MLKDGGDKVSFYYLYINFSVDKLDMTTKINKVKKTTEKDDVNDMTIRRTTQIQRDIEYVIKAGSLEFFLFHKIELYRHT